MARRAHWFGPSENYFSDRQGYVYFAQQPRGYYIKIGFSVNPLLREGLKTWFCRVLGIIGPCRMAYETALHERFAHLRVEGEWFEPASELTDFIFMESRPLVEEKVA